MNGTSRFLAWWRSRGIAGVSFALIWLAATSAAWSAPPKDGEEPPYPYYVWSSIHSIAYSRDGKTLASGEGSTMEGEIANVATIWDLARKGKLRTLKVKDQGEVRAVAYPPDGKILATGDYSIRFWDPVSGKELWNQYLMGRILSIAFSPDGKLLAMGGGGGAILLWDVPTRTRLAFPGRHRSDVNSVGFSPDGRFLASAASDKTVRIWDVATRKEVKKLEGHGDGPNLSIRHIVRSVAWSPDGKSLASGGGDETVRLWDVATGRQTAKLEGSAPWYSPVVWSADGKTLFSAVAGGEIRWWDVATGKVYRKIAAGRDTVDALALSPDGKQLASAFSRKIVVWDVATGKAVTAIERKPIAVQYKPSEKPVPVP
ncbi:MAG: WD40 repeat domain-containing protein [Pirellulales bacterium]